MRSTAGTGRPASLPGKFWRLSIWRMWPMTWNGRAKFLPGPEGFINYIGLTISREVILLNTYYANYKL